MPRKKQEGKAVPAHRSELALLFEKELRETGLSEEELAQRLGFRRNAFRNVLHNNGIPTPQNLVNIGKYFGYDMVWAAEKAGVDMSQAPRSPEEQERRLAQLLAQRPDLKPILEQIQVARPRDIPALVRMVEAFLDRPPEAGK